MARKTDHPEKSWERFLAALAKHGQVTAACKAGGVTRGGAYYRRKQDGDFAARWAEAEEIFADSLRAEIIRRAVTGVRKPVFRGGKLVAHVSQYSDRLLELAAKARLPEYRGKAEPPASDLGREAGESARERIAGRLARAAQRLRTDEDPSGSDGSGAGGA